MARLWYEQVRTNKKTYAQVPRLLKDQVKELLTNNGMEHLVSE